MDAHNVKRYGVRVLTAAAFAAGIAALLLLAGSVENSAQFSRWQPWILLVNICGVIAMMVLLARKFWQLYRDFRDHVPGSRLAMRTVVMFGAMVIAPLVFTQVFALAIAPGRAMQLPGAPYWLASALLGGSLMLAWSVTRRGAGEIAAAHAAAGQP